MDISHPASRCHSERVVQQVVARFKDHPAVMGYHIDNEKSSYETAGPRLGDL
jgi:beta-galactosidase